MQESYRASFLGPSNVCTCLLVESCAVLQEHVAPRGWKLRHDPPRMLSAADLGGRRRPGLLALLTRLQPVKLPDEK